MIEKSPRNKWYVYMKMQSLRYFLSPKKKKFEQGKMKTEERW